MVGVTMDWFRTRAHALTAATPGPALAALAMATGNWQQLQADLGSDYSGL